ncbi:MAG: glycosyltransferase family 4 protein [Actinomycetota bacterium]|nr:glycosyltransferase family 4 protein [Actinomycetota bacterium]
MLQLHNHHQSKGGAMEVLAHEAELLSANGHAVEQFTLPATETMGLGAVRAGAKAIWNVEASREVTRRIRIFRPDVVHVHTPFPLMSPAVFRAADRAAVPAVTTLHSYRWSCIAATCFRDNGICEDCVGKRLKLSGVRHRCYHDSLGASAALTAGLVLHRQLGTLDRIDRFITLTGFAKRLLIRDGVPASQIVVKANSVPDPGREARPSAEPAYVAFIGRFIDVKGIRTLLDAWPSAAPGLTLKIAGDGELRPLVEQRAAADPTIEYLGWRSEEEIGDLMGGAQCVIVPSEWYEGLPLVILRSLSVGTPIIVSNLENICAEVIADGAGITFDVGSPTSLTQALNSLITDPVQWQERRARARQSFLDRYSPAGDLDRLTAIYAEVINSRRISAGRLG